MFKFKQKKGFTLLELVVILAAIGILSTLGYKKYTDVMEDSKAASFRDYIGKAEVAYAKVISREGKMRPSSLNSSGDTYENHDSMRCYGFNTEQKEGVDQTPYLDLSGGSTDGMDSYGSVFGKALFEELLNIGFKEKKVSGLYVPGSPRTTFNICSKNGARFFAITNIKGSIALKLNKIINNGMVPSSQDGKAIEKRGAIWKNKNVGIYNHMASTVSDAAETEESSAPAEEDGNAGATTPYVNEETIALSPALTVTFAITQGTGSSSAW